ncbi:acyl CoA:acetate/3-ketoacid CoA transferase [Pelomyxa schiedti]|nr:acyl CoA:acetate/3-ketoacid CoA transferase [Pelomyxa schiedti]
MDKPSKVVTVSDAVRLIHDGDTIATGGFVGIGFAENVAVAIEERFLAEQHPAGITIVYAAGQGDGSVRGLNHFGHPGLVRRVIGGHWGLVPKLQKLAIENKVQAYNLPQGVISHLYRDIAAHKPRTITSVGLGTFVDPRNGGGKLNSVTTEDIVELINFDGKEYLAYKPFPINVSIVRGTTADLDGNVTMEKEALTLEMLSLAMAAKNSGGIVIAQVERICDRNTLSPKQVKIPGIFVDCVVIAKPELHMQTFAEQYNPALSGELRVPVQSVAPMALNERKIIARRAAFELTAQSIVNLGIGMPEGVSAVANEEKVLEFLTLTAEPGAIGGFLQGGLNFGSGINCQAIIDQPYQFDFYDGGGLDLACLGMAQVDAKGNVNVSKFGTRIAGAGGFINISQNAKKVVFMGTFTAGATYAIDNGQITITKEGTEKKFVEQVDHITFSGPYAGTRPILYITERCVFKLTPKGVMLMEVAPGIDVNRDILSLMNFVPIIPEGGPALMDPRIFVPSPMGLKQKMFSTPLGSRFEYNPVQNLFFVNLAELALNTAEDFANFQKAILTVLTPIDHKVLAIVNYDNFFISPTLEDQYTAFVQLLCEKHYLKVTRYATTAFVKSKLAPTLTLHSIPPNLCASKEDATAEIMRH